MNPNDEVLLIHAFGNATVRHALLALHETGRLAGFHTTIAWRSGTLMDRLLPAKVVSELRRRSYEGIPPALIHRHPWREAARLAAVRVGEKRLSGNETGALSGYAVCTELDRWVAQLLEREPRPGAVYGYEDGAMHTFQTAGRLGVHRMYELPIGHYRAFQLIAQEEHDISPEWAPALSGIRDSQEKLERKDRELESADSIFVASSFTAKTLSTYPGTLTSRVFVQPYGAPPVGPSRQPTRKDAPLRVLFVGSIGQRKGIGYLFNAVDRLSIPYRLTLLGRPFGKAPILEKALARHRWIPTAPHDAVLQLMREHDVLVFPSLFEGFGLVILEAMAQGTVVIATPNTAAPDLYEDGREGFIVPVRSAESIAQRLTELSEDRDLLARMSAAAQENARRRPWEGYRHRWVKDVESALLSGVNAQGLIQRV